MHINTQMDNSICDFDHLECTKDGAKQAYVRDYKSLDISKFQEFFNNPNVMNYVKINIDNLIEDVANKIYKSSDYWDLLCIINEKEALHDMPVNNDVLNEITDEVLNDYFYNINRPYQGPITSELVELYRENLFNTLNDKNFKNMNLKYLKPEYLTDFLRKYKYND